MSGLLKSHLAPVKHVQSRVEACGVHSLLPAPSAQPWLLSDFGARSLPPEATQCRAQCEPHCLTRLLGSRELNVSNCRTEDPPRVLSPRPLGVSVLSPLLFCRCDKWGPTNCVKARSCLPHADPRQRLCWFSPNLFKGVGSVQRHAYTCYLQSCRGTGTSFSHPGPLPTKAAVRAGCWSLFLENRAHV